MNILYRSLDTVADCTLTIWNFTTGRTNEDLAKLVYSLGSYSILKGSAIGFMYGNLASYLESKDVKKQDSLLKRTLKKIK
jgi:hypothetical protein